MHFKLNNSQGFSLLETLLVVSLMMVLMSFAIPPLQTHQQGVSTRIAWIHMQQIALSQTEYFMTQHAYTSDLTKLVINLPEDTDYRYSVDISDNSYTIHGNLINISNTQNVCVHLQLDSQGQKQAFNQSNHLITRCVHG